MKRGMNGPVMTISDGAPGLTAALEEVFPEALRQRCLAHKPRNITGKVSLDDHAAVKADVLSVFYAPSQEVARLLAETVVKKWQSAYPSAMASFVDDFEACIAYLRCPPDHHKYIRTTNPAERATGEEKRQTKTIPRFFDEKSCLKLCYASLVRASQRWQKVRMTDFDRTRLALLRDQLHEEYLNRHNRAVSEKPASKQKEARTAAQTAMPTILQGRWDLTWMASPATTFPRRSTHFNSSGAALISFPLPPVATCINAIPSSGK